MNPLFAVSVHDIDAGGLARSFDLTLPWLEHVLAETGIHAEAPGHADVRLSKTGHDVIVRGKVTATLLVPCARCLADTTQPIEAELSLLLRPGRPEHAAGSHAGHAGSKHAGHGHAAGSSAGKAGGKAPGKEASKGNGAPRRPRDDDEYEFSAEEADTDVYDGEMVVLDDFLREALLLEAPSFPLCSEDCPGIRPSSKSTPERGEPAMDPRLSPLRALKTKLMLAASDPDAAPAAREPVAKGPPAARPKLQAHRTASGAVKRAKAKQPSKKKAK